MLAASDLLLITINNNNNKNSPQTDNVISEMIGENKTDLEAFGFEFHDYFATGTKQRLSRNEIKTQKSLLKSKDARLDGVCPCEFKAILGCLVRP